VFEKNRSRNDESRDGECLGVFWLHRLLSEENAISNRPRSAFHPQGQLPKRTAMISLEQKSRLMSPTYESLSIHFHQSDGAFFGQTAVIFLIPNADNLQTGNCWKTSENR
jgi:hypothetical protein